MGTEFPDYLLSVLEDHVTLELLLARAQDRPLDRESLTEHIRRVLDDTDHPYQMPKY